MKISRLVAALLLIPALAGAEPANPKVMERYKQMLAANPVEGMALERLWKSALESGTTEALLTEYRKSTDWTGQMIFGHLLRRAGREADAVAAFQRALKLEGKSPLPALALAKLETDRTRPAEAAAWLERAVAQLPATDPRLPAILLQLGTAWQAAGQPAKAVAAWERTVAIDPTNLDLRRNLAGAYTENLLPEQAITHWEYMVEHGPVPDRTNALQQIAKLQSASGHPGEAMKALERAIALTAPDHWLRGELLGQLIRIAQRQRVETELEAKWKSQVEQAPRDLSGYLRLVEFYERTGELEKQREWLEKVVSLAPKGIPNRLKLARLLVQLDQLNRAAVLFDELLAAQPENSDLIFERARLDLQREASDAARARLAALQARKPQDEALRGRILEFYQEHHLFALVEQHLKADAAKGGEEELFALANFYFTQRRSPDGLATLRRLARPEATPEERAALLFRTAQTLKAQGESSAAAETMATAISLRPESRDFHLLLGELQNNRGLYVEARQAFEKAYELSANDNERQEVDGKVFQSLREEYADPAPPAGFSGRGPRRHEPAQAAVEDYIRSLMTDATQRKTAQGWLRVAQWRAWNGDKASPITFASKAVELEARNPLPHEFIARHAAANGDPAFALVHLQELLKLNPARRADYQREIAQLEMQRGNTREALAAYDEIARANPGQAAALIDLATAQERARQMDAAATTWRKALVALPAPRKREASSALLRVLQDLGQHEEACAMLLSAVDDTADERERLSRFDELLLYAQQHDRLAWLRAKVEDRRKLRADDYFTTVALGRVLKIMGEKSAAFELFADAALSAPKQAEALPDLIREAEELQRLETAVRLQEQFTRVAPQEGPDGFIKLAALCEKTGDLEGAERAWQRAVAKFPREVEVLRRAAEFHQQWGESSRAAVLWRKLLPLDPTNARIAATLGSLEYDAGRLDEARAAFETVVRLTKPVAQTLYPGEGGQAAPTDADTPRRLSTAGAFSSFAKTSSLMGFAGSKPSPETELRLGSLRRLAEIAQARGGAEVQRWVAEWAAAPDGTDALWALYFSGERAQVLDRIEARMQREPQNTLHRPAWVWIALESKEYPRLARWLNRLVLSVPELSVFAETFSEFVRSRPETVTPGMLEALFPPGTRIRLPSAAFALSSARNFPAAISLSRRVFDFAGMNRPGIGRELARMYLANGQPVEAQRVLEQATEPEGEWFDSPVYEAMRDYWILASPEQRAAFVQRKLAAIPPNTVHGQITRVLLFSLSGEESRAMEALDALLARRPLTSSSDRDLEAGAREWIFLTDAGRTLTGWGLSPLAERVWQKAFSDEGLIASQMARARKPPRLDNDEPLTADRMVDIARVTRLGTQFGQGGPVEKAAALAAAASLPRGYERLADLMENYAPEAAAEIAFYAWEKSTNDPAALRRAMDACRTANDEVTAEKIRRRLLAEKLNPGGDSTPAQFASELSEQLEQRGDLEGALAIITEAKAAAPGELTLAHRHATLLQLSGATETAEKELRALAYSDGGNALAREQLAKMLQQQGKTAEALALRRKTGMGTDPQLPLLLYQGGQMEEARVALDKLVGSSAVYAAMTLAEAMGLAGDAKNARSVLVASAGRISDPRSQLQLRSKLLRIPGAPPTPQFAARMQVKMQAIVDRQPDLADAYHEFFDRHAAKLGIAAGWETAAARSWANGTGPLAAGLSVLRLRLATADLTGAKAVCDRMLTRADVNGAFLERFSLALAAARQDDLRLSIAELNARRGWPQSQATLAWVQLLNDLGRREAARQVLQAHSWLAMFENGPQALGRAWLELGDLEMSRAFTQQALAQQPFAPPPSLLAQMARVQLAGQRFPAARLLLRRAFAVPACQEFDTLAEYLDVSGELPRWREAAADFSLPPASLHGLKTALFARFENQARLGDVISLIASEPALVSPQIDEPRPGIITCARLRALASKTGGFVEMAKLLSALATGKTPGAEAELAALEADRAQTSGDSALTLAKLEQAASLQPATWEFARRLADLRKKAGDSAGARAALSRYLALPGKPGEREAAFELWDRL